MTASRRQPEQPSGPFSRLRELLADRAAGGLDAHEEAELQLLLAAADPATVQRESDALEAAAAAGAIAMLGSERPALPAALAQRIEASGRSFLAGFHADGAEAKARLALTSILEPEPGSPLRLHERRPRVVPARSWKVWGGWLAAAASLALAAVAWLSPPNAPIPGNESLAAERSTGEGPEKGTQVASAMSGGGQRPVAPPLAPVQPSYSLNTAATMLASHDLPDARLKELRSSPSEYVSVEMLRLDAPGPDYPIIGEVVWFPARQEGFLDLRNMPALDHPGDQYQLWIFDALRDDRFPVNAGVFNIPQGQRRVVLPFAARLSVAQATHFAVTVERAGGVVVSNFDRVVLGGRAVEHGPLVPGLDGGPLNTRGTAGRSQAPGRADLLTGLAGAEAGALLSTRPR